ncbi:MAG: family 65 glycosyl hydrolase [Spirochaetia bacterium]|jgi:alpha,alpha-trehalose phosphorylase|nr:family 65 glycosyl hydrolase [Spirochaetia bacterium]
MKRHIFRKRQGKLDQKELELEETLFHNANGYLGVRGSMEEGSFHETLRGTYLNGVYDIVDMPQAEPLYGLANKKETLVNIADIQTVRLYADGELCTPSTAADWHGERSLDMDGGFTKRTLTWKSKAGKKVNVAVTRMASFTRLPLFVLQYRVICDQATLFRFETEHDCNVHNFSDPDDPRLASVSVQHMLPQEVTYKDGLSKIVTSTARSGITVATIVYDTFSLPILSSTEKESTAAISRAVSFSAKSNEELLLTRLVVCTDSRRWKDPLKTAEAFLSDARQAGIPQLFAEQKAYLSAFWKYSSCEIEGNEILDEGLSFNLYELLQSVGKDGISHLAAKGLSGEGYEGHYFWDTEMFVQPLFTLTQPKISKNLLEYRYTILNKARENARFLGYSKGALYPWRTINGEECSGFFPAGTAQYHINGAVAYALILYYLVTDDIDFMQEKGLEMLLEIARFWYELGNFFKGQFMINCVTGPDEYTCLVNNNYYTNVSAKYDFHWAVKLYRMLSKEGKATAAIAATGICEEEIAAFEKAEQAMFLPYDKDLDINLQDDSFLQKKQWDIKATPKEKFPLLLHYHPLTLYNHQVCKQADTVFAHYLYEEYTSYSTMLHSYDYYERLTTHDSSLSPCIFSIMASRLGLHEKAYAYFKDSIEIDIHNTHGNTKDGIHTANMGGSYLCIVFGFAGLRIKETGIYLYPYLPTAWKGYAFCLTLRNLHMHVHIHLDEIALWLEEKTIQKIFLYDKERTITEKKISFQLQQRSNK